MTEAEWGRRLMELTPEERREIGAGKHGPLEPHFAEFLRMRYMLESDVREIATERHMLLRRIVAEHPEYAPAMQGLEQQADHAMREFERLRREWFDAETDAIAKAAAQHPPKTLMYAIQRGAGGPIKLGWTKDITARMRSLQTASGDTLHVLATWEADRDDERRAHAKWAHLRTRGEWFDAAPELLEWIREKKTAGAAWLGEDLE